jgi:hypothetical protein
MLLFFILENVLCNSNSILLKGYVIIHNMRFKYDTDCECYDEMVNTPSYFGDLLARTVDFAQSFFL